MEAEKEKDHNALCRLYIGVVPGISTRYMNYIYHIIIYIKSFCCKIISENRMESEKEDDPNPSTSNPENDCIKVSFKINNKCQVSLKIEKTSDNTKTSGIPYPDMRCVLCSCSGPFTFWR